MKKAVIINKFENFFYNQNKALLLRTKEYNTFVYENERKRRKECSRKSLGVFLQLQK